MEAIMPDKQIFISYSRKDQAFVTALRRSMALQKIDTWVDSREMPAGKELDKTIKEAIEKAPAYQTGEPLTPAYERNLMSHYNDLAFKTTSRESSRG